MGLGKTLSTIALICSSLDIEAGLDKRFKSGTVNGTLIVTTKSSKVYFVTIFAQL